MYDANAMVPISKVHALLTDLVAAGNFLSFTNGFWRFSAPAIVGINTQTGYKTKDEAIDALLGVQFPELRKAA